MTLAQRKAHKVANRERAAKLLLEARCTGKRAYRKQAELAAEVVAFKVKRAREQFGVLEAPMAVAVDTGVKPVECEQPRGRAEGWVERMLGMFYKRQ